MSTPIKISKVCDDWNFKKKTCDAFAEVSRLDDKAGYFLVSDLQIDLDGSPQAYHPKDKKKPDNHTQAYDWLTSVKTSDLPGIQGEKGAVGPMPGYYLSATSYQDGSKKTNDAARYVDSGAIPYIVLPSPFPGAGPSHPTIKRGDCAIVVDLKTGQWTAAIYADTGRSVGEASLRTALNLGFDPRQSKLPPKVVGGLSRKDFFYLVFPNSVVPFPLSEAKVKQHAEPLFHAWGGMAQVRELFPKRNIPSASPAGPGLSLESLASLSKKAAKKRSLPTVSVQSVAAVVAPGATTLNQLLSAQFRPMAAAAIKSLTKAPRAFKETKIKPGDMALALPDLIAKYPHLPSRAEARAALFSKREAEGAVKLLAEGDSWFDFPFPLFNSSRSDVLDALMSVHGYAVVRDSKRGDVVENMCRPENIEHFVNLARLHKPKAFLFSGGGNDYVGGDPRSNSRLFKFIRQKGSGKPPLDAEGVRGYAQHLMTRIEEFVNAMAALNIPTILHGYGNAIPDGRPAFWKFAGPWLKPSTDARKYTKLSEARPLITDFLGIYNEELRNLADRRPGEVHYIDCRPHVKDSQWHDELHLVADGFEKVSNLFAEVIKNLP